jgi:hypothetical protein
MCDEIEQIYRNKTISLSLFPATVCVVLLLFHLHRRDKQLSTVQNAISGQTGSHKINTDLL